MFIENHQSSDFKFRASFSRMVKKEIDFSKLTAKRLLVEHTYGLLVHKKNACPRPENQLFKRFFWIPLVLMDLLGIN